MSFEAPTLEVAESKPEAKKEKTSQNIDHLNLVGKLPINQDGFIPLAADVEVDFLGRVEKMLFADYLHFVGASYQDYRQAVKARPHDSLNTILRDLHRQIVRDRLAKAEKLHARYAQERANVVNRQVETTRDHGRIFDMIINDLGLDGLSSESATNDVDYLDGIDHIVTFDHGDLLASQGEGVEKKEEGKKFFIGVQRTFNPEKKKDVLKDPVRILPSANGKGVVFRVFLQEQLSDYEDKNQETLMEKMDALRREAAKKAGLAPDEYGRQHRRRGYPGVYRVLPGGQAEQIKRVKRFFDTIKSQLDAYIDSPDFQIQSEYVQSNLRELKDGLHLEDYLESLQ